MIILLLLAMSAQSVSKSVSMSLLITLLYCQPSRYKELEAKFNEMKSKKDEVERTNTDN